MTASHPTARSRRRPVRGLRPLLATAVITGTLVATPAAAVGPSVTLPAAPQTAASQAPAPQDGFQVLPYLMEPTADSMDLVWFSETDQPGTCLLYTSPSPRDRTRSRMPSSA